MQHNDYNESGYIHFENFFCRNQAARDRAYSEKNSIKAGWQSMPKVIKNGSINSHSITSGEFINEQERLALFSFYHSGKKLKNILNSIFPEKAVFLNTQLFFDPFNPLQQNYWHRDIQYTGLSIDDQKRSYPEPKMLYTSESLSNLNWVLN